VREKKESNPTTTAQPNKGGAPDPKAQAIHVDKPVEKTFEQKVEKMRSNIHKPSKVFKFPYQITAVVYQGGEEDSQSLAVGLIDGAIIIIDLVLGIEKFFIEKHPTAICALAFYEDRILVSGSICGRVNLCDLDSEN
jgi:hypothetical protein